MAGETPSAGLVPLPAGPLSAHAAACSLPFSLGFTFTREPSWHVSKSMQIMGFGKVVLVMAVAGQNVLKLNVLSCHR